MAAKKKKPIEADGIPVYCSHTAIVSIESVIPNPENPNTHPPQQIDLLAKIIEGQGWRNPIVVSALSGFVVKGHGRLLAAQHLGVTCVPVDAQPYASKAAEHADMIADNRIAELSEIDNVVLKDLLQEMDVGEIDMDYTGFMTDDLERLMTAAPPPPPETPDPGSTTGKDVTCPNCQHEFTA